MELRDGYKITEIGTLPMDWNETSLKNITKLMTNGFVGTATTHYTDSDDGVLYIQGYNVEENTFNFHGIKRVTHDFHKLHLKSKLQENDLLTVQTGDVGLTTIIPKILEGANCHALIITRFIKNTASPKFYSFYFNSHLGRLRLKGIETGTTMKHINVGDLINFTVPLPPLPEQQAIAEVLSDTDNLIQALEKQIAKKRLIKQGVMQKLLTPKEGWEVRSLGEIANIVGGGTPSTFNSQFWNGDINWFTPTEIGIEKYVFESNRKITKEGLSNCSAKILPMGTILLTSRAGIGDVSILKKEACTNQGFQSLIVNKDYNNEYLYYLMLTLKKIFLQNASGSTFLEISPNRLKQIEVLIPNLFEQTQIAKVLCEVDSEIGLLEKKRMKYIFLKQGLMQNLLAGRIRLLKS